MASTENLYFKSLYAVDSLVRSPENPINLRTVTCSVRDDLLNANHVERFQIIYRKTVARFLMDTCDKILSNEDWLESDWSN